MFVCAYFVLKIILLKNVLTVVHHDDMKTVHQLAFVFMDSLHLNIENRVNVDIHTKLLFDERCKSNLVFLKGKNYL